jgi:AAA domain
MNYGRESNVINFDLKDVDSKTLASGSIYNEGSCAFAMTIIKSLILAGVPGSKAILTPYQGQYRILMSALQVMTKTHPEAKKVDVGKIDRRQGSEWDICVIDVTRTSGAEFLYLLGRLNTLFSRGKNGLNIIGKKSHIDKLTKSQGRWLQKFQSEYLRFRTVVVGKPTSSYYQPGQINLNNIYVEEELEEQEDDGNNDSWEDAVADYQGQNLAAWG